MTNEEFLQLYPAPADADFLAQQTVIDDARTEINQLHSFLKSGSWPQPGLHDVDMLSGTAISYP